MLLSYDAAYFVRRRPDARSLPVLPEPDSRDVLTLPFRTERIMLTMVLILAAAAIATCGVVVIVAGILAPRSPIKAAPRRRAF
jgi:hypothetical protein